MELRLSGVVNDSIVDGPGLRLTVFTQGCPHNCVGCHNPQTHDPQGGYAGDTDLIIKALAENPLLDGITLSGGEPFLQPLPCLHLAEGAKNLGFTVWAYTGYSWEQLITSKNSEFHAFLEQIDVLIDGPFLLEQRSLDLLFCGSRNQRLIDVKKSLKAKEVILWEAKTVWE